MQNLITKTHIRESNLELARIVAMAMIVIGHFVVHGVWNTQFCTIEKMSQPLSCMLENLIYSFCVCGVNIFVLISGYFKIKVKVRSFLSFWSLCAFYSVISAVVNPAGDSSLFINIFKSLFISNSQWFFAAYLWLYFLSPVINVAINNTSLPDLRVIVCVLFVLNSTAGWVFHNANVNGYSVLQMVFIYLVGAWVRREPLLRKLKVNTCLVLSIACSIIIFVFSIIALYVLEGSNWIIYYYNNPLVVFTSVLIFCYFSKLEITSRVVNSIAKTVVAAIFIQDFIASKWIYSSVNNAYNSGGIYVWQNCLMWFMLIFVAAYMIENIRLFLFRPVIDRSADRIEHFKSLLVDKIKVISRNFS